MFSNIYAQFIGGTDVYIYKYDHKEQDGILSNNDTPYYYFVNFQKNMMGFYRESNLATIRQNLSNDTNYYNEKARNDLAQRYSNVTAKSPGGGYTSIYEYQSGYSTTSKYTYREHEHKTVLKDDVAYMPVGFSGFFYNTGTYTRYWGDWTWNSQCYSFSIDKSTMIIWDINTSGTRYYYKRIQSEDLQPDIDFLYD